VPDPGESVVHRGAGGGVDDSKVLDKFYSPVAVAMRMRRQDA